MRHISIDELKDELAEYQLKKLDINKFAVNNFSMLTDRTRTNMADLYAKQYYCSLAKHWKLCFNMQLNQMQCPYFYDGSCMQRAIHYYPDYKNMIIKYRGNNIIALPFVNEYRQNFFKYIATDKRRIIPALKQLAVFQISDDNISKIMSYILQQWQNSLNEAKMIKLFLSNFTVFNILFMIDHICKRLSVNKSINNIFVDGEQGKKLYELLEIDSSYVSQYNIQGGNLYNMELTARVVKVLYTLTDGDINKFNELAKIISKILLTKKVCKYLDLDNKSISVIKTSNKYFVKQFFRGVFLEEEYFIDYRNKLGLLHTNNPEALDCTRLSYHGGISDGCIYTEYNLADLCDEKNIGKFIEDSFVGHLLNVCTDLTNADKCNMTQLEKIADGTVVHGNNDILGKQEYRANDYNIIIIEDLNEIQNLKLDEKRYSYLELSDEIDIHQYIFNAMEVFTRLEKDYILKIIGKYGVNLLFDKNNVSEQSSSEQPIDIFKLFIENCCTLVSVEEGAKIDETNATAKITLEAAYGNFSKIFNKTNNSTVKIDNDLLSSKNINAYITKGKNDAIRRRDIQNGYAGDEVLSEGSNASYVKGILVKSKEEIKNIAEGLQGKNTNAQNMSLDEFAEFLYRL